jgi:predicted ATPase
MIIRIKIEGFKSLFDTELYFGPFTCIAGVNGIGKSNFFDALMFLAKLADNTIIEAAKSIRSEDKKHSDIKDIFYKSGDQYYPKMKFEVDMLVSSAAEDDLGQEAEASITCLQYVLELQLNIDDSSRELIEIKREELLPLTQTEAKSKIHFKKQATAWINSVIKGKGKRSTKAPFISTEEDKIKLHQDGSKGRTTHFVAPKMPRTLLSTVTAESPTAFMVRYEMRNWLMVQLEPSALREPNNVYEIKNAKMTANGGNLPATLYRLHLEKKQEDIYQLLTNQMTKLVPSIDEIRIDNDEKRELLTLQIRFKDGLTLPAQSLSDGTLRFLGLAIIKEDGRGSNLICLEEPENGIHPKKIKDIITLLQDMATDTNYAVADDNPLRQVIINSHSPIVVQSVPEDSLYIAKNTETYSPAFGKKISYTSFAAIKETWRAEKGLSETIASGDLIAYLAYENHDQETDKNDDKLAMMRKTTKTVLKSSQEDQINLFQ